MLVGKFDISPEDVGKHTDSIKSFLDYSDSFVPVEFSHLEKVLENQRYLCCMLLRRSENVSWTIKNNILNHVLSHISICGFADSLIDIGTIYNFVDMKKVDRYLEG